MAPAAVELVQRFFDALNEHDTDALVELAHPEVEFSSLIVEVEGGFRGRDGVRRYLRELFDAFPDLRIEIDGARPVADGAVVKLRVRASGAASGVLTDLTDWQALDVRDGKAAWWAFFRTEAEAVAAIEARS
jgi:ketosteroid isomerase-like protein